MQTWVHSLQSFPFSQNHMLLRFPFFLPLWSVNRTNHPLPDAEQTPCRSSGAQRSAINTHRALVYVGLHPSCCKDTGRASIPRTGWFALQLASFSQTTSWTRGQGSSLPIGFFKALATPVPFSIIHSRLFSELVFRNLWKIFVFPSLSWKGSIDFFWPIFNQYNSADNWMAALKTKTALFALLRFN